MLGIRDIKPVITDVKGRDPKQLGRRQHPGGFEEVIQEGHYADGQARHGVDQTKVHTPGDRGYNSAAGRTHRADLRETPHPDSKR